MDSWCELKQNPNERRQELYEINSNTVKYCPEHWDSLLDNFVVANDCYFIR